jgi:hypothetical protein
MSRIVYCRRKNLTVCLLNPGHSTGLFYTMTEVIHAQLHNGLIYSSLFVSNLFNHARYLTLGEDRSSQHVSNLFDNNWLA